ncbi:unnamed protein product [Meloidogyne enterolobii]|uniref:Uncharacterized protein n=1 Tax=Meloidogyne enterolobii TaxID=390850 RepID=A0ACB0Y2X1_MELEN
MAMSMLILLMVQNVKNSTLNLTCRTTLFCLSAIYPPLPPPPLQQLHHRQRPPLQRPPHQHQLL